MLDDPRANASLLILEIGNSHVSVATSVAQEIRTYESFRHDQMDAAVEHAKQTWAALPEDRIRAIAAGSVVPDVLTRLRTTITDALQSPVLVVGDDLHRPLSSAIESPESVGIDRVCAAAAAYDQIQAACVIASFGTAITVDCVNGEGAFLGGAIMPGIDMQAKALHAGTAVLPEVAVEETGGIYGENTEQAIRNGILFGVVGSLREITERYASDLMVWPRLVVTGGNGELVKRHCDFVDALVPDLCVRGIALAYRKHFSPFDDEQP